MNAKNERRNFCPIGPVTAAFAALTFAACASAPPFVAPTESPNPMAAAGAHDRTPQAQKPAPQIEQSHFVIENKWLGRMGSADLLVVPTQDDKGRPAWAVTANGSGSVMGLGHEKTRIDAYFQRDKGWPSHWRQVRHNGSKQALDAAEQKRPGRVMTLRERPDEASDSSRFLAKGPVYDPISLTLLLRDHPPQIPLTVPVLERRNLWLVTVQPGRIGRAFDKANGARAIVYDMHAVPMLWNRQPSEKRSAHNLRLWLENGPHDDQPAQILGLRTDSPLGQIDVVRQSHRLSNLDGVAPRGPIARVHQTLARRLHAMTKRASQIPHGNRAQAASPAL